MEQVTQNRLNSETAAGRGGVWPLLRASTVNMLPQPQRRAAPPEDGESELSRHPRHAPVADRDSDLPLPHTRNAVTLRCSTAADDNRI